LDIFRIVHDGVETGAGKDIRNLTLVGVVRLTDSVVQLEVRRRLVATAGNTWGGKSASALTKQVEAEVQLWYDNDSAHAGIEWVGLLTHNLNSNLLHVAGLVAAQRTSWKMAPTLVRLLHVLVYEIGAAAVGKMLTGEDAEDAYGQTPYAVAKTGGAPDDVLALLEGGDSLQCIVATSQDYVHPHADIAAYVLDCMYPSQ
jgi:hypothetical protein